MENPCHNCLKRYPGCHASCEDYKSWKAQWDEMRERGKESVKLPSLIPRNPASVSLIKLPEFEVTNNGSCNDSQGR